MNLAELEKLVAAGESNVVEPKKSTAQLRRAAETLCAMLNGYGGKVLLGVTPGGRIIGQKISDKTLREVAAVLGKFEPAATVVQTRVDLGNDKEVLVLGAVPKSESRPYVFDGRPYQRVGSTTSILPQETYQQLLAERSHSRIRWENQPAPDGIAIDDLDVEEIQITLDNAIRLGRLEPTTRQDPESILRGLELVQNGKLLNAAVALYGKSDRLKPLYPQLEIRLARFRGRNRLADFTDNRQYWGHAFALLRRAESFFMDHVPIAGRVVPGKMVREDQPWYPPRATREAIANAICHRDYTIPGGAVAVAMYDDHLEITNPGTFHFGITPEKLTQPHESKPWNPILANVFYRAGIIERWGTGTLNILDWCRENGNPEPAWQEQAGSVYVVFQPVALREFLEVTPEVTPEVPPEVRKMLFVMSGEMTRSEIMKKLGLKDEKHFRENYQQVAVKLGLIEMTIPDKPRSSKQKYRVTEKGSRFCSAE